MSTIAIFFAGWLTLSALACVGWHRLWVAGRNSA